MKIDIKFDFRSDSAGRDPDSSSPTLKRYHIFLWSKQLPTGEVFKLTEGGLAKYLLYKDGERAHHLSSDSIVNSYGSRKNPPRVIKEVSTDLIQSFISLNSTIGGFILFPGNQIEGAFTINQDRGINPVIADRFDLTLECIRRYFENEESPLQKTLKRYESFFTLFKDFKGYVDFFLLNDLVTENYSEIAYFNKIYGLFETSPIPAIKDEYLMYRENSMQFTINRNKRILKWAESTTR
jgi:hypothetical protein